MSKQSMTMKAIDRSTGKTQGMSFLEFKGGSEIKNRQVRASQIYKASEENPLVQKES